MGVYHPRGEAKSQIEAMSVRLIHQRLEYQRRRSLLP
jgi:hypothetical protein